MTEEPLAPPRDTGDKLTDAQRRWVIRQFAEWKTPAVIRDELKELWGVELSRQAVRHYSPASPDFPERWRQSFEAERAAYVDAVRAQAAAHRAFRVAALSRAIIAAEARGNFALVGSLCEIAAREMGDAYTNRQRIEANVTTTDAESLLAAAEGREVAAVESDVPPVVQPK